MNKKEIVKIAQKYIMVANELDAIGLDKEAMQIDKEIKFAIDNNLLPIKKSSNNKNIREAIRGRSDWNDYLENTISGAGAGAGAAASTIVGAPAAGMAALVGGGLGAVQTAAGDLWFNHFYGQTTQIEKLSEDLFELSNQVAKTVYQFDPQSAQQILQIATNLKNNVKKVREQKRIELSKKYGLDPNAGFLQSIMQPISAIKRNYEMAKAKTNKQLMHRQAVRNESPSDWITDPTIRGQQMAQNVAKERKLVIKGLTTGQAALGLAGGIAGGAIANYGYNVIGNKLRGQIGVFKKQLSDISKIGSFMAQISEDQSLSNAAQQIVALSQRSLQAMQQNVQPVQQTNNLGYNYQ